MTYTINDQTLINTICDEKDSINKIINENRIAIQEEYTKKQRDLAGLSFEFPLDEEVLKILRNLNAGGKEIPYSKLEELDELWTILIKKSINCLRYFDEREPFIYNSQKQPYAHGIDRLQEYYKKYEDFESLLYGTSKYYRDHIFHAVRTWLLGLFCLLNQQGSFLLIDNITIDGIKESDSFTGKVNFFEKISMWTITALCHDLGYPLEKSQQILDKTKGMMAEFISNPTILSNFSFSSTQDNINEYILRFLSTKMNEIDDTRRYLGRIQPKYYLKYSKSLENYDHGIISAVIIYKMLLYFIESDFNLNDDHKYDFDDAKQFYIRREMLRAMSSHTCKDIYNINITTFASILFLCDEMQEWGRKSWNDMYLGVSGNSEKDSIELLIHKFNAENFQISETISLGNIKDESIMFENIYRIFNKQYEKYKVIFRDGQYTNDRKLDIKKIIEISVDDGKAKKRKVEIEYELLSKEKDYFKITLNESYNRDKVEEYICQKRGKESFYRDEIEIVP